MLVDEIVRLRAAVRTTKAERPFDIDAWVVLPDHLHAVWTLPRGMRIFRRGGVRSRRGLLHLRVSVGRGFTPPPRLSVVTSGQYAGVNPGLRQDKGEVAIWQRRFWEHHIRNDADYLAHVRYCWMNPVKHRFVERPEAWRYSSVHRDARFCAGMDLVV